MNTKIERFFSFIMKEKMRNFFAFAIYLIFIGSLMEINLPIALQVVCFILLIFLTILICSVDMIKWMDKMFEMNNESLGKSIIQEIKKITKELLIFIPIFLMSIYITSCIMAGQSANQTSIEESFYESPIYNSISIIIIGPIIEEFFFRFLPYKFIKNKTLYIILSAIIFAAMHVLNDPNGFYYIWFYMIRPLYYGYRYHKTKDILVPISMHSLNNLVATLLFVLS